MVISTFRNKYDICITTFCLLLEKKIPTIKRVNKNYIERMRFFVIRLQYNALFNITSK